MKEQKSKKSTLNGYFSNNEWSDLKNAVTAAGLNIDNVSQLKLGVTEGCGVGCQDCIICPDCTVKV